MSSYTNGRFGLAGYSGVPGVYPSYFPGALDDVSVLEGALSTDEICDSFRGGSGESGGSGSFCRASEYPPLVAPHPGGGAFDGDPVDLGTGLFVYEKTDLQLADSIPALVKRTYRPGDDNVYGFGRGTTSPYDMRLWSENGTYDDAQLILPDGGRVPFTPDGATLRVTTVPGRFFDAELVAVGTDAWEVRLRDGTVYSFGGAEGALTEIRDRHGDSLEITRDGGRVTRVTTEHGRWVDFSYVDGLISQVTDNAGRTVGYTYDASDRLATVTTAAGTTTYTYDADDRMTAIEDPRGITWLTSEYDAQGRVIRQTSADGGVYEFAYQERGDECGGGPCAGAIRETEVTDPRGNVRVVAFDQQGLPVSDTAAPGTPEEQTSTYVRDPDTNQVVSTTDQLGRTTTFSYDASGNVTEVTTLASTANAATTAFEYAPGSADVTRVTDALGKSTDYAYDPERRLTLARDATGRETTFGYSTDDPRPTAVTNPAGQTFERTYQGADLASTRDPLGNETLYDHDGAGRLTGVTDPTGRETRYAYDALNQLTRITDPAGGETLFEYDPNGNQTKVIDARGNQTSATYDAMDRVASKTDGLGRTEQFSYDLMGNLVSHTDRRGEVTTMRYDALDRKVFTGFQTEGPPGAETYESEISYGWDAAGRLVEAQDSAGGTFSQTYDARDNLVSQSGPHGTVGYTHDVLGRRTSLTAPGQLEIGYSYDDAGRLTGLTRGIDSVTVGYDQAGRRSSVALPNGVERQVAYDAAGRVSGLEFLHGTESLGSLAYQRDSAGRVTTTTGTLARTGLPEPMGAATYDAANQRTSQDGQPLAYDANGNLTQDPSRTYTWNDRNQLAEVTGSGSSATYGYDPFGRRSTKAIDGQTTNYLHAGPNVIQEQLPGGETANLLTGLGYDDHFARTTPDGTDSFLTDPLGSTIALTDDTGATTTNYTYSPFGQTTQQGAPSDNPFQYTGRENDNNGLYNYRARYYNPTMARFTSEDPIGLAGGDPNLYAYAANNPTSHSDPTGLHVARPCPWGTILPGRKDDASRLYGCTPHPLVRYLTGPPPPPLGPPTGGDDDGDGDHDEHDDGCDETNLLASHDEVIPYFLDPGCDGSAPSDDRPGAPPYLPQPPPSPQHPIPTVPRPDAPMPFRPVIPKFP